MITAKVIADSVNFNNGVRLITLELEYPRYIHAEFMTHRVFSRNASSSRAVPVAKMIDKVERKPVMPLEWGANKPGMQAGDAVGRKTQTEAEDIWIKACYDAAKAARALKDLGIHKQITNRLLEPFSTIKVIVTATDWSNFFELRISPLAQPEIRRLAEVMKAAMDESTPILRGQYEDDDIPMSHHLHAPYITEEERTKHGDMILAKCSVARCARVSYLNHDGLEPSIEKDLGLTQRLLHDRHASCFEHVAVPSIKHANDYSRNIRGWDQYRELINL